MDTFYTFIKKRFIDICLVTAVVGVFFMSGQDPKPEAKIPSPELVEPATTITQAPSSAVPAQYDNIAAPGKPTSPLAPSNNTQVLPHQGVPQNQAPDLQNTFKMMEGGTVSTEAIIERNTYFKKLSEQMRNLQGQVDTDSSGKKDLLAESEQGINNPELGDPLESDEFFGEDEEVMNEIYEELKLIENQAGQ